MESAKAVLCPAHECSVIWGRSLITTATRNHLSSCDSLARCTTASLGQNVGLVFLSVSDMLQVSGALMVQHCSDEIGGHVLALYVGILYCRAPSMPLGFGI